MRAALPPPSAPSSGSLVRWRSTLVLPMTSIRMPSGRPVPRSGLVGSTMTCPTTAPVSASARSARRCSWACAEAGLPETESPEAGALEAGPDAGDGATTSARGVLEPGAGASAGTAGVIGATVGPDVVWPGAPPLLLLLLLLVAGLAAEAARTPCT